MKLKIKISIAEMETSILIIDTYKASGLPDNKFSKLSDNEREDILWNSVINLIEIKEIIQQ